jgi:hypothetical protein
LIYAAAGRLARTLGGCQTQGFDTREDDVGKQAAKPIDDVTNGELISFPVWEFAIDQEQSLDETAIQPVLKLPVSQGVGILFCTQVRLASGETQWAMLGNLDPQDADQTARCLTISFLKAEKRFHLAQPVDFHYETHGPRALCDFLGMKLDDVFPIRYDVHSVCQGDPAAVAGEITL